MNRAAAKLLFRAGLIMLMLCIGCLFLPTTRAAMVGDILAIVVCIVLCLVTGLWSVFSRVDRAGEVRFAKTLLSRDRRYGHLVDEDTGVDDAPGTGDGTDDPRRA